MVLRMVYKEWISDYFNFFFYLRIYNINLILVSFEIVVKVLEMIKWRVMYR